MLSSDPSTTALALATHGAMYGAAPLCNGRSDGMDYCEAVYPLSSFFKVVQNEVRYEEAFEVRLRIPKR